MRGTSLAIALACGVASAPSFAATPVGLYGLGDGADGPQTVSVATVVNRYAFISKAAAAGALTVTAYVGTNFKVGDEVLVQRFRGTSAGTWEFNHITTIVGTTVTLAAPLTAALDVYGAQLIRVPNFTDVHVLSGGSIASTPFTGYMGGVVVFRANGTLTVDLGGKIQVNGAGYRGTSHVCWYNNADGMQGESSLAVGAQLFSANGSGGGGGQGTQDSAGGGGGGHATVGGKGADNPQPNYHLGGYGGAVVGQPDLGFAYFGGAGGEGGADEDGGNPGAGGNGGGIIFISAGTAIINGTVEAQGAPGGAACQFCCGGSGCGMGGGGGGAGGTIYLASRGMTVAANALNAAGGVGDVPSCNGPDYGVGGLGSVGRIRLDFLTLNTQAEGTTGATTAANQSANPDPYVGVPYIAYPLQPLELAPQASLAGATLGQGPGNPDGGPQGTGPTGASGSTSTPDGTHPAGYVGWACGIGGASLDAAALLAAVMALFSRRRVRP